MLLYNELMDELAVHMNAFNGRAIMLSFMYRHGNNAATNHIYVR